MRRRPRLQFGQLEFELPEIRDFTKPAIELHKNGRRLLFKPCDPIAANILRQIIERMDSSRMRDLNYWDLDVNEEQERWIKEWRRIELWKHLKGNIAEHPICRILQSLGVEVGTVPSLANYIRKELRKQQIEATPFPAPPASSDVSLFQRCSVGLTLRCIKKYSEPNSEVVLFDKGKRYLVVSTGGNGSDVVRISKSELKDKMTLQDKLETFEWSSFHPTMEDYFDDSEETELGKTVEEAYPELVKAFRQKAETLGYPIYEHSLVDAPMEALKRGFLNCKLMRMGKTREAITVVNLWGSKSVAVFGSEKVRITWRKEFQKIGITDYIMVDSLDDLDKPARFYLMKYSWIRAKSDASEKDRKKYQNYLRVSSRVVNRKVAWTSKPQAITVYQHNPCPHCQSPMERPVLEKDTAGKVIKVRWLRSEGYMCRNPKCVWKTDTRKMKGAAWGGKLVKHKPGTYVDYGLAAHSKCPEGSVHGRQCRCCKETDGTWTPQITKRVRKKFSVAIADEIHRVKDITTQTAEAVYRLRCRRRVGLTGTLLGKDPTDAYWIMHWVIGGPSENFPYLHTAGRKAYEDRFCEHVTLEKPTGEIDEETGEEIKKTIRRSLPYFKNPPDWWRFSASKVLRRNYDDPLYKESLRKAGMFQPEWAVEEVKVPMIPAQIKLMLSTLKDFKEFYNKAVEESKAKNQEINKAFVMSQMTAMRITATIPSFLNKRFDTPIYTGVPGGGKMYAIENIAKDALLKGSKVVILTDFIEMQKEVQKALEPYGVIRFDPSWDADQMDEGLASFNDDPNMRILVAGTRAVSESLDLSVADYCICCDVLWTPPDQCQAWSRILTPTPRQRKCKIFLVLSKNSIDEHMFSMFYARMKMSEQGLDRRAVDRRALEVDYQLFAELVIQEEANLTVQMRGSDKDDLKIIMTVDENAGLWEDDRVA